VKTSAQIQVAVFGGSGRMGKELVNLICKETKLNLCASIDAKSAVTLGNLKKYFPDVVIDFSSPEGTVQIAKWCAQNKVALITGTTGLKESQEKSIQKASKKTAIFKSANMGLGINALAGVFKEFLKTFSATEIEIEETHHRHKKDRPSGTAKFLLNEVKASIPKGRKIKIGEPVSLRGGEIFGVHKVNFYADGEWLSFEHTATDRSIFARGALKAAQWIKGKKPGMYSMKDMLFNG